MNIKSLKKLLFLVAVSFFLTGCIKDNEIDNYLNNLNLSNKAKIIFSENFNDELKNTKVKYEKANNSQFLIMKDFKDPNNNMLKITLQQGEIVNNGNRAEFKAVIDDNMYNSLGDEIIYQVDFMIDKQYIDRKEWQSIFQLHDQPDFAAGEDWESYSKSSLTPPLMINYINGDITVDLTTKEKKFKSSPYKIEKDKWYTLTVQIKNEITSDGYINVLLDNQSLTNGKVYQPTVYNSSCNYAKIGIYRNKEIDSPSVIYFDNLIIYSVK